MSTFAILYVRPHVRAYLCLSKDSVGIVFFNCDRKRSRNPIWEAIPFYSCFLQLPPNRSLYNPYQCKFALEQSFVLNYVRAAGKPLIKLCLRFRNVNVGACTRMRATPKQSSCSFTHRNHLTSIKSHYGSHFKDFGDYGENCYLLKGVLTG